MKLRLTATCYLWSITKRSRRDDLADTGFTFEFQCATHVENPSCLFIQSRPVCFAFFLFFCLCQIRFSLRSERQNEATGVFFLHEVIQVAAAAAAAAVVVAVVVVVVVVVCRVNQEKRTESANNRRPNCESSVKQSRKSTEALFNVYWIYRVAGLRGWAYTSFSCFYSP